MGLFNFFKKKSKSKKLENEPNLAKEQSLNVEHKKTDNQNIPSDNSEREKQESSNSDTNKTKLEIDFSEINAIIEKEIKADFVDGTYILSTGRSLSDVLNLEKAIDNLLNQNPDDSDFLFAKSEVQYASLRQVEGKETREKLMHLHPNHYNANLREKHPDNWTNLFGFPYFNEDFKTLPDNIYKVWKHNNAMVQIVRDNLTLSLALIAKASEEDFPSDCTVVDYLWKPVLVETPYGDIFVHYLMVKFDDGFVYKREGTINPYFQPPLNQKDLLIERLYNSDTIFLTCASDKNMLFNKRYPLTDKHKNVLKRIVQKIEKTKPQSSGDTQSAQNWYWNNISLDDVTFDY